MSFVTNPEDMVGFKTYKCNKKIAHYLIYEKNIPVFSINRNVFSKKPYIFAITDELLMALKEYASYNNHGA